MVDRDHEIVTENRHKILIKEPYKNLIKKCQADAVINHTPHHELTKLALKPSADAEAAMMQHE